VSDSIGRTFLDTDEPRPGPQVMVKNPPDGPGLARPGQLWHVVSAPHGSLARREGLLVPPDHTDPHQWRVMYAVSSQRMSTSELNECLFVS